MIGYRLAALMCVSSILTSACAVSGRYIETCDVYTYFNYDKHNLTGLIYLDERFERTLIEQMNSSDRALAYCWYANGEKLVAKPKKDDALYSFEYEFSRTNAEWLLLNRNDVIQLPSHEKQQ